MEKRRSRLVVVLVVVVALGVLAVLAGPPLYSRWVESRNPDPITLTSAPDVPSGELDPSGSWTVAPGSEAGYRVEEVLRGEDTTVVGRSSDVSGTLEVADGQLTAATVTVQTATIETGVGPRDNFLRDTLESQTFPTATFELGAPVAVPALTGEPVAAEATGRLTIRDVTRDVTVALQVQRTADGVRVSGTVPVTFTDFEIEAPSLGFVEVEDAGTIEMLLVLTRS